MGLTEDLRAAVDNPPPADFDLDRLMARGRARRARSRALSGLAAVAALVLMITGGYALAASRHHNRAPITFLPQAPAASSTPPSVIDRLTAALATLPPGLHVPTDGSARFTYIPADSGQPASYHVAWTYQSVDTSIDIVDQTPPPASDNGCAPGNRGQLACQRFIDAHGTTYILVDSTAVLNSSTTHKLSSVMDVFAYRPDNTEVTVYLNAHNKHTLPYSDTTDMLAAAYAPGLTLHP